MATLRSKVEKKIRQVQLAAYQRFHVVAGSVPYDNVYYCCTQKTASQWFKAVFNDPIFYRYTGLSVVPYVPASSSLSDGQLQRPFLKDTIATHLYIDYPSYASIPKPERYKTFFVLRDPRDVVVSWYFSTKFSHYPYEKVVERRKKLEQLDLREGLKFSIDELREEGLFAIQRTWTDAAKRDAFVRIFKYEDFASDNQAFLERLFRYLGVQMPYQSFATLCERHRFKKYAGDRKQGENNTQSHYRKGVAGDWQNYFDADVEAYFSKQTGEVLEQLGY